MHVEALRVSIRPPQQKVLLDYWLRIRGDRRMPARADIRPEDIDPRTLPHVGLIDVLDGGERFRYRLVGTAMNALYGCNYTGQFVDAAKAPGYASALIEEYRRCARHATIRAFDAVQCYAGGHRRRVHRLLLPLSSDGAGVDMILFSTVPDATERFPHAVLRTLVGRAIFEIERDFEVRSLGL